MESPSELGILADYRRVSATQLFINIIWEIIANRRWNPDKSTAKFLFATFGNMFILGTNHLRTRESIEKEHTPFKFNVSKKDAEAQIGSRGYGAGMFPFHVQGKYANVYRLTEGPFTTELKEWGMKRWININKLCQIIDNNEVFNPEKFRSQYDEPLTDRDDPEAALPFFCRTEFENSELGRFVTEHNFKYFYVFTDFNNNILANLEETLNQLAKIYEGHDVEIYYSQKYGVPQKASFSYGYGLLPKDWTGAFIASWRLGEKIPLSNTNGVSEYYKSEFSLQLLNSTKVFYGKNDSNGSAGPKFALRLASFQPKEGWTPDVRITVAMTTPQFRNSITDEKDKSQEQIYIRIEGELISLQQADPIIASKLRHLKLPGNIRLILDILREPIKNNPDAGLNIMNVKAMSGITQKKAIHEMIMQTLSLFHKHLQKLVDFNDPSQFIHEDRLKELAGYIDKNLEAANRSSKRKREGLKFEAKVSKHLATEFDSLEYKDIEVKCEWETNDSTIAANHNIRGQAIDTLGRLQFPEFTIWVAVQSKDRENAVPMKEIQAFIDSVESLRKNKQAENSRDKVIGILALAKAKSFKYEAHWALLQHNIHIVLEKEDKHTCIGNACETIIFSQLEQLV